MKIGFRVPSIKKRIAARTSLKRIVRNELGVKAPRGWGWLTNPKKAGNNRIYNRTTVGCFTYILFLIVSIILVAFIASAEVYKWEDANGMHFTDSPGSVPDNIREKVYDETRKQINNSAPPVRSGIIQQNIPATLQVDQAAIYRANLEQQRRTAEAIKQQQLQAAGAIQQQKTRASEQLNKSINDTFKSLVKFMLFCFMIVFMIHFVKNKSNPTLSKERSRYRREGRNTPTYSNNDSHLRVKNKRTDNENEIRNSTNTYGCNEDTSKSCDSGNDPVSFEKNVSTSRRAEWGATILNAIEWRRFEKVCVEFFRMKGYLPRETKIGADGGVDINLFIEHIENPVAIVQCKAWNTYKVGVKPVRELFGVMAADNVEEGFFVTSGKFTTEAEQFAQGKKIKLISGHWLLHEINKLTDENQRMLLDVALEGDYRTPTCPQCDLKMVLRVGKFGNNDGTNFWGCVNYPRCKQTFKYKDIDDIRHHKPHFI